MAYTPTSPVGIALVQLQRMVTLSSTFQTAFDLATAADALPFVLIGENRFADLSGGGAFLYLDDTPVEFQQQAGGQQLWLHPNGKIVLQLLSLAEDADDTQDRYLRGVDFATNVVTDIKALSGSEDTGTEFGENHLDVTRAGAEFINPGDSRFNNSRGLMFLSKWHVDWGIV